MERSEAARRVVAKLKSGATKSSMRFSEDTALSISAKKGRYGMEYTAWVTAFGRSERRNLGEGVPSERDVLEVMDFLVPRMIVQDVMES